jgi:outer membrane receptor protein involved in Fe transport
MPLASSVLVAISAAHAQETAPTATGPAIEEIVVTSQKRSENLQDVPLSITALGTEKLEELHVTDFNDYAQLLPSVSFQTFGPGFAHVYMRGVVSGGDGNHSGSLPSVGTYLDEQPITTIQGNLDIHVYDIERVEALAGPQGTLYGASSQAGTIRIITNKPDPGQFEAGYDLQGTTVANGDQGYNAEGFVNIPISDSAAVRLVGWWETDPGYIDNVAGFRQFPTSGICLTNDGNIPAGVTCDPDKIVRSPAGPESNYNDVDTYGGRAALKIDLNDNWTITPGIMAQKQQANGIFAFDPSVGELEVAHFYPEGSDDKWWQGALTVEGKIGNLDFVYAGAYLKRDVDSESDYTDYSYFYDVCCGYGVYWYDDAGDPINPSQFIQGKDRYKQYSNEFRISTPADKRVRFVGGLYQQRHDHDIEQRYRIDDLAQLSEVTGWPDTWWLTEQVRVDRDYAAFGELTADLTDKLQLTGGIRFFKARNTLAGYFGFGFTNSFGSCTGEHAGIPDDPNNPNDFDCPTDVPPCDPSIQLNGGPCENLNKEVEETGNTPKISLSYHLTDSAMIYGTYSEGFRPGGLNRRGTLPPYKADYLYNYEFGWKTTLLDSRVRFNGAIFFEDWKNFQFSFLGENSLTQIANAANAEVKGLEADVEWAATDALTLSMGLALYDPTLKGNYCGELDENDDPITDCADPLAPDGQQLPVTPKQKGNVTARYNFTVGQYQAHVQGTAAYVGSRWADLRTEQRDILGKLDSYTIADFTGGISTEHYSFELFIKNAFDERGILDRYAQCDAAVCGLVSSYNNVTLPRTIGLQFGQRF